MNANEGISLAKMAVGVLVLCLVLSGTLLLWYMLYDAENEQIDAWSKAANSAAQERLGDLVAQSKYAEDNHQYDEFPLVTNVCNALEEFPEDGVVFVSVYDNSTNETDVYTYTGLNLDLTLFSGTVVAHSSSVPLTHASSGLLKDYNKNRCRIIQVDVTVDATGKYTQSVATDTFVAYSIEIVH